jgi:hypothetical protein
MSSTRRWRWLVLTLSTVAALLALAGGIAAARGWLERGVGLLLAGVVMAGFAVLAAQVNRDPDLNVRAAPDGRELVVRFGGWDALWTLRREVRVRTADLTAVGTIPVAQLDRNRRTSAVRGTLFPGVIQAGSFTDAHGRQLWDIRASGDALLIDLGPEAEYRRMALQVPEPHEAARQLRSLIPG